MIMKLAGIAMIVFSCFGLGIIKSMEIQKRYRLLKEWERLLLFLEQEISYHVPLPEAYRRVGDRTQPPFDGFLKSLARRLQNGKGESFGNILEEESRRCLGSSCLSEEDLQNISMMGQMLGFGDRQAQGVMLKRYEKELEGKLEELKEQLPGKQKLYRSLGFLGGAFLGILLL
ncbi:MAG: stage III sporulation protein AB [Ruminococcus sp.]|jgi:stage III sporulation protein AB